MGFSSEIALKILLSILAGGLIGAEREFRHKAAGFRTIIFICVGATLFTIFSLEMGGENDPARIAANIVSGIGFLGAGAIMHDTGHVRGLTTAATIWLAAALGMGIGGGYYTTVGLSLGITLVILWTFPQLDAWLESIREARTYEIICTIEPDVFGELRAVFLTSGLRVQLQKQAKVGGDMICTWYAYGSPQNHAGLTAKLFANPGIKEFRY